MSTHKTGNGLDGEIIPNGTVTQICNLLYRRFSTCRTGNVESTTEWESAPHGLFHFDIPQSARVTTKHAKHAKHAKKLNSMCFIPQSAIRNPQSNGGFSLVEMMVAVAVMAMIMVALLAMFSQATRALRSANNQTDILESGRAVMDMIGRELQQAAVGGNTNTVNFYSQNQYEVSFQQLPGGERRTNDIGRFYFITQENTLWSAIGYSVVMNPGGYGTLYRYQTNGPVENVPFYHQIFLNNSQNPIALHQVADGILHFKVMPFDNLGTQNFTNVNVKTSGFFSFSMDASPAFVEIELGVLEPPVLKRVKNMSPVNAKIFLEDEQRTASVHLFRQRVAIIAGGAR